MKRDTLLDFFDDRIRSPSEFLIHDDGYRSYVYTYDQVRESAGQVARRLGEIGISPGDKIVVWGENSPQWITALWGTLLARAVLVPIDFRASPHLVAKVSEIVAAKVVMVGEDLKPLSLSGETAIWPLKDFMTATAPVESPVARPHGGPDDLAEIIFTSGATAEPKGVQLTHHNILANIVPVEREVLKYRVYARPFAPLRFLNLLPLSHMFGQAMATFIPPMLSGVTIFMRGYNPADIIRQIRKRRVSVVVCVPKILDVLRDHIIRSFPELADRQPSGGGVAARWWRYRRVHRTFGLKFWAFVVGAAPLDPDLEAFWSRLGFLVIQGYGLTETAPIVTLNHPFRARRGTVGTPIGGVDVKIASDGEILVRGANVTSGYYNAPAETAAAFEDGWFHTGDIGAWDDDGRLTVRGRKKEVIVTPEGLNVFPEDVERVLTAVSGVQDAGVIGVTHEGHERVHAVIVLDQGVDPSAVLRDANARLEDHQKIRSRSIWPDARLPRTEGTQKLKRRELKRWVESGGAVAHPADSRASDDTVVGVVQQFVSDRAIGAETTLEELGFSSIERIELLMALEQAFDRTIDELAFSAARTVGDLEPLVADESIAEPRPLPAASRPAEAYAFPSWNRHWLARVTRRLNLGLWILPLTRVFAWIKVEGAEHLEQLSGSVVFAANHQSHMDGPVILAALPSRLRYAVATAAAKEFFAAHFHPDGCSSRQRFTSSLNYYLATWLFNVFPLPQREAGTRDAIRYLGELLATGMSVLIFPEGRRTDAGEIGPFQPGIGMVASRLRVPIVPVRIEGLDRVLHKSWRMAVPGRVRVAFGKPISLGDDSYRALAQQVEAAVKAL